MLVVFVEGSDDRNYFNKLLKNDNIQIFTYACHKADKVNKFIKSISCMPNCGYIFFADSDGKTEDQRKIRLMEIHPY